MRCTATVGLLGACVVATQTAESQQQQTVPHVAYVYPAGGQHGTTFQVRLGGQFLNGVRRALVSGAGVEVRVLGHERLLTAQELTALRDTAQGLQRQFRQTPNDPVIRQRIDSLVDRLNDWQRRRANPSMSEIVTLEISISADAPIGDRSLRLQTPLGLSNPLVFRVGQLAEFREVERRQGLDETDPLIPLPAVVNGRLIPHEPSRAAIRPRVAPQNLTGDVDRYRFHARAGQHLVATASARALRPYLGDAVPGWVQATLTVRDARGREVAYNDDFGFDPDPTVEFDAPSDGDYVLEIRDALYRGREDFVYRVAIGEATSLGSLRPSRAFDSTAARHFDDGLTRLNEREPNSTRTDAQQVASAAVIVGRIDRANDWDVFSLSGRAGDTLVAEVYARRLNSLLDAVLELSDGSGRRIAWNDDQDDRSRGLETHHADSRVMATLPATGRYYLRLGDVQRHGGPEYQYLLRISGPRPDFELRVSPSSINASGANTVPVTVTAIRRDGFSGDIALALENAPRGFVLSGAVVPAGQDQVKATLTFPPASRGALAAGLLEPAALTVIGTATIHGKVVQHSALPADDMMQAFFYHHLVVTDGLWATTQGRGGVGNPARLLSTVSVKIACGSATSVRIALPLGFRLVGDIELHLIDPPEGITMSGASIDGSVATLTLNGDESGAKPGQRGNLLIEASGIPPRPANARTPAAQQPRRMVIGYLPAIEYAIVK